MSADLHDRVAALRPAPTLEPAQREAMLTAITGTDRAGTDRTATTPRAPWSPRRRRLVVGASLAGLAAAAAIVVPAVVPSSTPVVGHASPAAAAELRRLAVVVEHHRSVTLGPHQYLYIAEDEMQTGLIGYEPNGKTVHGIARTHQVLGTSITHRQGWTSRTGRLWRRDDTTDPIEGHRIDDYLIVPDKYVDTPGHFASMPTDPAKLNAYLRSQFGSSSDADRNVFEQLEFILQTGIAPSSLRSAALRVMAETDGVTMSEHVHDSMGRRAERFTLVYRRGHLRETEFVYLDARDARVLETASDNVTGVGTAHPRRTTFVDTVRAERVVDSVPTAVRQDASRHK